MTPKKSNGLAVWVLVALLLGVAGYLVWQNMELKKQLQSMQLTLYDMTQELPEPTDIPAPDALDPLVGWKTYTDSSNRFSFRYPENLLISFSEGVNNIFYLRTENYKPYESGSYQVQITTTANPQGIPQVLPSLDKNTPEGEFVDTRIFITINGARVLVTSYKEGWVYYKRYDVYSDTLKVGFFGTGTDHAILDQILSTFEFTNRQAMTEN